LRLSRRLDSRPVGHDVLVLRCLLVAMMLCLSVACASPAHIADDTAGTTARGLKLAPYVACLNSVDLPLHLAVTAYRLAAVPASGSDLNAYGASAALWVDPHSHDAAHSKTCVDDVRAAIVTKPAIQDVDASAGAYADQLSVLLPTIARANAYYAQHHSRDDRLTKERQYRSVIGPGFVRLFARSESWRRGVERETLALKRAELADIGREEGRSLRWHVLDLVLEGHAVCAAAGSSQPRTFAAHLATYSNVFHSTSAYAVAHREETIHTDNFAEADIRKDGGWYYVRESAKHVLSDANDLQRERYALRGANDAASMRAALVRDFNTLLNGYNGAASSSGPGVGQFPLQYDPDAYRL
jgi:hypothetical protein